MFSEKGSRCIMARLPHVRVRECGINRPSYGNVKNMWIMQSLFVCSQPLWQYQAHILQKWKKIIFYYTENPKKWWETVD